MAVRSVIDRLLLVLILGVLVTTIGRLGLKFAISPRAPAPSALPISGLDTVAILVVSSLCGACKAEPAATEVGRWLDTLLSRSGSRPRLIGVSVDTDVTAGLELLQEFGEFDEISVGSGFMNTAALKYIWRDSIPFAGVPQLLVFERVTRVADSPLRVAHFEIPSQRIVGLEAIAAWLRARGRQGR